jgi:hypothetical protein
MTLTKELCDELTIIAYRERLAMYEAALRRIADGSYEHYQDAAGVARAALETEGQPK